MINNSKKILFGIFFLVVVIFILLLKCNQLFLLLAADKMNIENAKFDYQQICDIYKKNNLNYEEKSQLHRSFTLKEDVRWVLSIMNNPYFVFGLFSTGLVSSIIVVFVFNIYDSFYQLITTGDGIVLCIGWTIQSGAMVNMLLRYFGYTPFF